MKEGSQLHHEGVYNVLDTNADLELSQPLSSPADKFYSSKKNQLRIPTTLEVPGEQNHILIYRWEHTGNAWPSFTLSAGERIPNRGILFCMGQEGRATYCLVGPTPDGKNAKWALINHVSSVCPDRPLWDGQVQFLKAMRTAMAGVDRFTSFNAPTVVPEKIFPLKPPIGWEGGSPVTKPTHIVVAPAVPAPAVKLAAAPVVAEKRKPMGRILEPKKPKSAYHEYLGHRKRECIAQGTTFSNGEIRAMAIKEWGLLTDEQKQPFFDIKAKNKIIYDKKLKKYQQELKEIDRRKFAARVQGSPPDSPVREKKAKKKRKIQPVAHDAPPEAHLEYARAEYARLQEEFDKMQAEINVVHEEYKVRGRRIEELTTELLTHQQIPVKVPLETVNQILSKQLNRHLEELQATITFQ